LVSIFRRIRKPIRLSLIAQAKDCKNFARSGPTAPVLPDVNGLKNDPGF
jgi:hypothetical protein